MNKIKQKILISRIRKGDSEAFREVYKIYSDRIYRFVFYRLPSENDARDLLQETFFNLWDYLNKKDIEVKSLQALIYQIAKNLISNYYKKNEVKSQEISLEEIEYKVGESAELDYKLDIKLNIQQVNQNLSKLKNQEQREVIEMKYVDELSHKEIAQLLNKTEQNVRTILHRAMKNLKSKINEFNE